MGWLPIIHLVHMGAELCELNPTPRSFLSCRFHTHVIHTKTLPRILDFRSSMLCWEHVVDLNRRSVTAHVKSTVRLCRWQSGLNLFTSERQHWRRRKMLQGWVSLWGGGLHRNVWQRLPIETGIQLIICAVIRCRGKKAVNGDYSFIKPSFLQFSIALFLSLHTSLMSAVMKSLFWLASFCLITFNEQWMIHHSNRSR